MAWSWHRSTTSNLAVSLTAILLVSGIHNNGMEFNNATSNLAEPLTAMSNSNNNNKNNRRKTLTTKHRK
jgi:hypothetical protein